MVPRVPPDLHDPRGRDPAVREARPRVHRPGGVRGGARDRPVAAARDDGGRAGPGRARRRHRRRADLARRRGRRLGHVRRLRALRRGVAGARVRAGGARRRPTARAAAATRSRSSGGAGRPGSSPSRCTTRRASGCASDRRLRGRWRRAGRIVVDGAPVGFEAGDSVAIAILRAGEVPGHGGMLCLAGDCGNCLAEVDGVAYVRTCQVAARPGHGRPAAPAGGQAAAAGRRPERPSAERRSVRRSRCGARDVEAGRHRAPRPAPAAPTPPSLMRLRHRGRRRSTPGRPSSPASRGGMLHVTADEIVVATGAAEIQPVCRGDRTSPGSSPRGAAARLAGGRRRSSAASSRGRA